MKIRKAVIPAAGLGTRVLPASKAMPKEMLSIVDKPAIQFIVEEAVASGVDTIIIITGRTKKSIEDHFDRSVELEAELDELNSQLNGDALACVWKAAGILVLTQAVQDVCREAGHAALAGRVEMLGRLAALAAALPLVRQFAALAAGLLG